MPAISNLVETSLNVCSSNQLFSEYIYQSLYRQLTYLFMVYVSRQNIAPLFGFAGASMTLTKTTIWILQEHFCGHCSQSSTSKLSESIKFWVLPNMWENSCVFSVNVHHTDGILFFSNKVPGTFSALWLLSVWERISQIHSMIRQRFRSARNRWSTLTGTQG